VWRGGCNQPKNMIRKLAQADATSFQMDDYPVSYVLIFTIFNKTYHFVIGNTLDSTFLTEYDIINLIIVNDII